MINIDGSDHIEQTKAIWALRPRLTTEEIRKYFPVDEYLIHGKTVRVYRPTNEGFRLLYGDR